MSLSQRQELAKIDITISGDKTDSDLCKPTIEVSMVGHKLSAKEVSDIKMLSDATQLANLIESDCQDTSAVSAHVTALKMQWSVKFHEEGNRGVYTLVMPANNQPVQGRASDFQSRAVHEDAPLLQSSGREGMADCLIVGFVNLKPIMEKEVGFSTDEAFTEEQVIKLVKKRAERGSQYKFIFVDLDDPSLLVTKLMDNLKQAGVSVPVYFASETNSTKVQEKVKQHGCQLILKPLSGQSLAQALPTAQ